MIDISLSDDERHLVFKASGPRFTEIIESFKYANLRYDPKTKLWVGDIGLYNDYRSDFDQYKISVDEYTIDFIYRWKSNLRQLRKITKRNEYRKYIPELMRVEPITR